MENTKRDMKKHADAIKRFVLNEAEKVRATYADIGGNCFYPTTKKPGDVNEDDGITAKIEVCDTCKKEPCECEKVEESPIEMSSTGNVAHALNNVIDELNQIH